jgi:trimeric autotransporter adhesin
MARGIAPPMAQDRHHAFGFSHDATTINMSDLGGVSLAAVKALDERTAAQQETITARGELISALEAEPAQLRALIRAMAETPAAR